MNIQGTLEHPLLASMQLHSCIYLVNIAEERFDLWEGELHTACCAGSRSILSTLERLVKQQQAF